jgi:hypothetical protein
MNTRAATSFASCVTWFTTMTICCIPTSFCQELLTDIVDCITRWNILIKISFTVQLLRSQCISSTFAINENYVKFLFISVYLQWTPKPVLSTTLNWINKYSKPHQRKWCTWSAVPSLLINSNIFERKILMHLSLIWETNVLILYVQIHPCSHDYYRQMQIEQSTCNYAHKLSVCVYILIKIPLHVSAYYQAIFRLIRET